MSARYSDLGRFYGIDPKTAEFPGLSAYQYSDLNPIMKTDIFGMNADWYEDECGEAQYNPDIHGKAQFEKSGIKGNYLFASGYHGNGFESYRLNADGTKTPVEFGLAGASADRISAEAQSSEATGKNVSGLSTVNSAFGTTVAYGEAFSLSGQGKYVTSEGLIRDINPARLTANSKPYATAGGVLKSLGRASAVLSFAFDSYAYRNNQISAAKFGLNTTVTAVGLGAGAAGMAIPAFIGGAMYFGVDTFYPGGWRGAMIDQSNLNKANSFNPYWQIWPGAMKQ